MSRHGKLNEGNEVSVSPQVVAAEMVLPAEVAKRIEEKRREDEATQANAYADLKPALAAVASYQGKTAVVDFSIQSRTRASCGREICSQCPNRTKYSIQATFRGYNQEDYTVSESDRTFNYFARANVEAALVSLKGIVEKTQDQRLADYLKRCKKADFACADPLLSSLTYFSDKRKLDAVAVRIDDIVVAVPKEEMQEYSQLSHMISDRYNKQKTSARNIKGAAGLVAGIGISSVAFTYMLACAVSGGTGTFAAIDAATKAFATNPAVYATFLAVLAVVITVAVVLHVKAKKRLVADKVKYALPESVTLWQECRAKAGSRQESQAAKVEAV